MKALYFHHTPFALTRGGAEVQIERMRLGLQQAGVQVDLLSWWDPKQTGDIIHHFGRPELSFLRLAHSRGFRVVLTELLGGTGSRPAWQLLGYKVGARCARRLGLTRILDRLQWGGIAAYAEGVVASTAWEAKLFHELFGAAADRVHVVTNGVDDDCLNAPPRPRGPWLISTAWIGAVKRTLETAQAAIRARTPIWIVGKPRFDGEAYCARFMELARQHPDFVRYEGWVSRERLVEAYREARGFVLFSKYETLSLSALDAAACECPLLLMDQAWARSAFGNHVTYCPNHATPAVFAEVLRKFYDAAPALPPPPRPPSWGEIGQQLKRVYTSVLAKPLTGRGP